MGDDGECSCSPDGPSRPGRHRIGEEIPAPVCRERGAHLELTRGWTCQPPDGAIHFTTLKGPRTALVLYCATHRASVACRHIANASTRVCECVCVHVCVWGCGSVAILAQHGLARQLYQTAARRPRTPLRQPIALEEIGTSGCPGNGGGGIGCRSDGSEG